MILKLIAVVATSFVLLEAQAVPTYDRMATTELFLRQVYPGVFPQGAPVSVFEDSPGMVANTGVQVWAAELRFDIPHITPSLSDAKADQLPAPSTGSHGLEVNSASGQDCTVARYRSCAASGQVRFEKNGNILEFRIWGSGISEAFQKFLKSLPSHHSDLDDTSEPDSWNTPPLTLDQMSHKLAQMGAKYPPTELKAFRNQIPIAVIQQFSGCRLDVNSAEFKRYGQIYQDYQKHAEKGYDYAILKWHVSGVAVDPTSRSRTRNCLAEFEPFNGRLISFIQ